MKVLRSLIDWFAWERLSATRTRHTEIINRLTNMAKTQAELAADLAALNEQQKKIAKEQSDRFDAQTAAIKALEETIRNAPVSAEVEVALAEVKATTDALDATIPDAPAPTE